MAIYLYNVKTFVFSFFRCSSLLIKSEGLDFFNNWCSLTTPYSTWGHIIHIIRAAAHASTILEPHGSSYIAAAQTTYITYSIIVETYVLQCNCLATSLGAYRYSNGLLIVAWLLERVYWLYTVSRCIPMTIFHYYHRHGNTSIVASFMNVFT
jgi:hypothetical protein